MEALRAETLAVPAEATVGRVIGEVAAELDRLCARREAVAKEVEEVFLAHPLGELLSSMPGTGPRTGRVSWPKSATVSGSLTATTWPPTPAWPPSPVSRTSPSMARLRAGAATTA